jgi:Arc/MetJ family transcription regulator
MRTNIDIDSKLIAKAKGLIGVKTKREAVIIALEEAIKYRERLKILDMAGKFEWEGDLDAMRRDKDDLTW